MKRLKKIFKPEFMKMVMESAAAKILIGIITVFLWNWAVNSKTTAASTSVGTGCFFLSAYFIVWAWIQYLVLDGVKSLRFLQAQDEEDGEETEKRFCSDLICAVVFLIPGLIL